MFYILEINEETLQSLRSGKYVEGSLHLQKINNGQGEEIVFNRYNRKPSKKKRDRVLLHLEHGWLKESAQRVKFFCSVKKTLEIPQIKNAMQHDMNFVQEKLDELDPLYFVL